MRVIRYALHDWVENMNERDIPSIREQKAA